MDSPSFASNLSTAAGTTAYAYPASEVGILLCLAIMGYSRADSLLLTRVITHSAILGYYLRRFDLFAINHLLRNRQLNNLTSALFAKPAIAGLKSGS